MPLFVLKNDDWSNPNYPIVISKQFYNYVHHLSVFVGDPTIRDLTRQSVRHDQLPRQESMLSHMRDSMRSSMCNLLGESGSASATTTSQTLSP
jgi:hypothetical protein